MKTHYVDPEHPNDFMDDVLDPPELNDLPEDPDFDPTEVPF